MGIVIQGKRRLFVFLLLLCAFFNVHSQDTVDLSNAIKLFSEQKYSQSIKTFKKLLELNPLEAGFYLGQHYLHGYGVEPNEQEAIKYFSISGEAGNSSSQQILSLLYITPDGTVKDSDMAFYWSYKSLFGKDAMDTGIEGVAIYNLSRCYINGIGTKIDKRRGEMWMAISAMYGCSEAGDYYEYNYGIIRESFEENDEENDDTEYINMLMAHLDSLLLPLLSENNSNEAMFVKAFSLIKKGKVSEFRSMEKLYHNDEIANVGKNVIGSLLIEYYKSYKYDLYNAEIIEHELKEFGDFSNEDIMNWILEQYCACIPK